MIAGSMEILHVSDLPFGAHNSALADNLMQRVKSLQPDLIVCTGDLADERLLSTVDKAVPITPKSCLRWSRVP